MPRKYLGISIGILTFAQVTGVLCGKATGEVLPDPSPDVVYDMTTVRLLLAEQGILSLVGLIIAFTYIKHDTALYYLLRNDRESAILSLDFYYDANSEELADYLERYSSKNTIRHFIKDAICTKKYNAGSWTSIFLVVLMILNGFYAVVVDAEVITSGIAEVGEFSNITGKGLAYIMYFIILIGTLMSFYFVHNYGRRELMLVGMGNNAIIALFGLICTLGKLYIIGVFVLYCFALSFSATAFVTFMVHVTECNVDIVLGTS